MSCHLRSVWRFGVYHTLVYRPLPFWLGANTRAAIAIFRNIHFLAVLHPAPQLCSPTTGLTLSPLHSTWKMWCFQLYWESIVDLAYKLGRIIPKKYDSIAWINYIIIIRNTLFDIKKLWNEAKLKVFKISLSKWKKS